MQTICGTAIRVSELQFFTVEAVKHGEVVVSCKGKTRTILIPGKLRKRLLEYAQKQKIRSGAIFITRNGKPLNRSHIWAQIKALCEEAGVNPGKVFPHNLRKLFARTFYGIEKDTEQLKVKNPMEWVRRMNNIRERVNEVVNAEMIFI